MDPSTVKVTLPGIVAEMLEFERPRSLPTATFCALLIEQGLDAWLESRKLTGKGGRGVGASEPQASNSQQPQTKQPKNSLSKSLSMSLARHEELVTEFWKVKKGSKGETAWKLLNAELTKLQAKYGDAVVEEQLQLAINGKWAGIRLSNYEQFKAPKGNAPAQPEFKHPAARVFRNGRFVDEDGPTTNPVLEGFL